MARCPSVTSSVTSPSPTLSATRTTRRRPRPRWSRSAAASSSRGPEVQQLEGEWTPGRVVVIEFPDRESAQGWWDSDAYEAIKPIRREASTGNLILVDGYPA